MRHAQIALGIFGVLVMASAAQAQTQMPCPEQLPASGTCYSGKDENGAFYFIVRPANWNGVLVVTAHGGPNPFGEEKLDTPVLTARNFQIMAREGFALVGSSFRRGGFGV